MFNSDPRAHGSYDDFTRVPSGGQSVLQQYESDNAALRAAMPESNYRENLLANYQTELGNT